MTARSRRLRPNPLGDPFRFLRPRPVARQPHGNPGVISIFAAPTRTICGWAVRLPLQARRLHHNSGDKTRPPTASAVAISSHLFSMRLPETVALLRFNAISALTRMPVPVTLSSFSLLLPGDHLNPDCRLVRPVRLVADGR